MKAPPPRLGPRRASNSIVARATSISIARAESNDTRQIEIADEFGGSAFNGVILQTPYNVPLLFSLIENSNMLQQCIEAYVTNTVMSGWEIAKASRKVEKDSNEEDELQSFIDHANSEQSLLTVMADVVRDRESCGFGFLEVIRDGSQQISLLRHAKALFMRLTAMSKQEVLVNYSVIRGKRTISAKEWRKFRRFVQVRNGVRVWFKEFGDPRKMDSRTGVYENDPTWPQNNDPDFYATEIVHFKLPSNEAYGKPRWTNQIPSIMGSREAEEFNLRYFQENTVPPMMLLVSGGRLTAASFDALQTMISQGAGADRQNRIQIVEAVGEADSIDGKQASVSVSVEKLTTARQSDSLFGEYDNANQAKVRSSFRLPPVVVGMANEHNFATAQVAAFTAETQVFAPARFEIDERLNNILVQGRRGLNLRTVVLASRTPIITSPDMVIKTLTALNVMGAVTPRSAQATANAMLQLELDEYPDKGSKDYEEWMDQPLPLSIKQSAPGIEPGDDPPEAADPADGEGEDTHVGQASKTDAIKGTEASGNVAPSAPEHGSE